MAQTTLSLRTSVAWWVKPYLQGVALFAWLTRSQPDVEKVSRTVAKGVTIEWEGRVESLEP